MTTKEKAEAYDKAIQRAKEILEIGVKDSRDKKVILSFFPELKEDEEERIRKWCISHFKECFRVTKDNVEYQEYLNNKVIPWLEQQGNPTKINPSEFDLRLNRLLKQFETLPKEDLQDTLSFYLDVVIAQRNISAEAKEAMYGN